MQRNNVLSLVVDGNAVPFVELVEVEMLLFESSGLFEDAVNVSGRDDISANDFFPGHVVAHEVHHFLVIVWCNKQEGEDVTVVGFIEIEPYFVGSVAAAVAAAAAFAIYTRRKRR